MPDIYKFEQDGVTLWPATATDAVIHPQARLSLTDMISSYNVTKMWGLTNLNDGISRLGSTLLLNEKTAGVRIEFTNSSGVFEAWEYVGGGKNFTDVVGWKKVDSTIIESLEQLVFPLEVTFKADSTTIPAHATKLVRLDWNITRKGVDVTTSASKKLNDNVLDLSSTGETVTINTPASNQKIEYVFSATYQGITETVKETITAVDISYFGKVGENWEVNATNVKKLTTTLLPSKEFEWNDIALDHQKSVFAYPQYFGKLESIKDANNAEYIIDSYTLHTNISIDSVPYFIYVLTRPTTITNFKQSYK